MYVFSFGFWLAIVALALVHAVVGPRLQRLLLVVASLGVYASINPTLLYPLAAVVVVTWLGVRAPHYTDDRAMLRAVRVFSGVLAFVPLLVIRLADDVVGTVGDLAVQFSLRDETWTIGALLPVGLAFYTLQAIDAVQVNRYRQDRPGFLDHLLFVSFFPTLVVGPVQRYEHLAPQLRTRRRVTAADLDMAARLVAFGSFWKLVVADNLLPIADVAFASAGTATAVQVVSGTLAFSLGIVADLAGYSALAVAAARLFGVRLVSINVRRPYLARSPIGFWSRWLVPVSAWLYDRVFLGLGGAGRGRLRAVLALVVTFAVGTWWYGGGLNVAVWGVLHLLAVAVQALVTRRRAPSNSSVVVVVKVVATFGFVTYGWLWFRAESIADALRLHLRLTSVELTSTAIGTMAVVVGFGLLLALSDRFFVVMVEPELEEAVAAEAPEPAVGPDPAVDGAPDAAAVAFDDEEVEELLRAGHRWHEHAVNRGVVYAVIVGSVLLLATTDLHTSVLGLL